jgi:hypothetical protein
LAWVSYASSAGCTAAAEAATVAASGAPATTPLPARAVAPAGVNWLSVVHRLDVGWAAADVMVAEPAAVELIISAAATAAVSFVRVGRMKVTPLLCRIYAQNGRLATNIHRNCSTTYRRAQ